MSYKKDSNNDLISVCIATYNRGDLLKKLLESLVNQKLNNNINLEIVITDNNPNGSAKSVVDEYINYPNIKVKYFIQPVKNISLTRNVCLQNARGNFIAFIDDDETADENWINNLYSCLKKFNADGVFGYVIPIFANDVPESFRKREYYFSPIEGTGEIAKFFYTTNAMIKYDLIKTEKDYFDPSYGLTGGEDVHFFERLQRIYDCKFVTCIEAITYEYIPVKRANLKYLFNRALQGGQSYLRRKLEFNGSFIIKFFALVKSLLKIILGVLFYFRDRFIGKPPIKSILLFGDSFGKILSLTSKYKSIY